MLTLKWSAYSYAASFKSTCTLKSFPAVILSGNIIKTNLHIYIEIHQSRICGQTHSGLIKAGCVWDERFSIHTHTHCKRQIRSRPTMYDRMLFIGRPLTEHAQAAMDMPRSLKKQLRRREGAGLGPEPHSDGAFPWQWAAPRLNGPPLFMLFGGEAGFPPCDRWPFSHKMQCLDLACSGARQQSSDDTAFSKQLPDAATAATESTENWLTYRATNQMTREAARLRLNLPRGETEAGTQAIMTGLRNQRTGLI